MDRRTFLKTSVNLGVVGAIYAFGFGCGEKKEVQTIALDKLPYLKNALEPYISEKTLSIHYDRHYRNYFENVIKMIRNESRYSGSVTEIIHNSLKDNNIKLFNNAAQVFNHSFYWNSMKPNSDKPQGHLKDKIDKTFGDLEKFKKQFHQQAVTNFGSGWTWLVSNKDKLEIVNTSNAETPITKGYVPIIVIDVWEHAYYLDYQNKRPEYVQAFVDNLINWDFAAQNIPESVAQKV